MKGEGGVVGLIENFVVLRRWMVVGLEFVWMVEEFEEVFFVSGS